MKFNFKIQQYQTDAVDAVVRVFQGQGFHDKISYIRDRGKVKAEPYQMTLGMSDEELEVIDPLNDTGYKNEAVELSDEQLLHNIQTLQSQNNIKLSASLVKDLGRCSLDIEMETGTGKTYVYTARRWKCSVLLFLSTMLPNTLKTESPKALLMPMLRKSLFLKTILNGICDSAEMTRLNAV